MSERVVTLARSWIGTPYLHQASTQGVGADCLGLVRGLWLALYGQEPEVPPHYTPDWGEFGGQELLMGGAMRHLQLIETDTALLPGQVLLFRMRQGAVAKHLGVLAEAGDMPSFVHAYNRHGVIESPLSGPWRVRIAARFRFP